MARSPIMLRALLQVCLFPLYVSGAPTINSPLSALHTHLKSSTGDSLQKQHFASSHRDRDIHHLEAELNEVIDQLREYEMRTEQFDEVDAEQEGLENDQMQESRSVISEAEEEQPGDEGFDENEDERTERLALIKIMEQLERETDENEAADVATSDSAEFSNPFPAILSTLSSALKNLKSSWLTFKTFYRRSFSSSELDDDHFKIFTSNVKEAARKMASINPARKDKPKFGINKFTDLNPLNFQRYYTGAKQSTNASAKIWPLANPADGPRARGPAAAAHPSQEATADEAEFADSSASAALLRAPDTFDFRKNGIVTPVKNQRNCGSCWAFAAVETVESAWALSGHSLHHLSVQQVIDCDYTKDTMGCNGGFSDIAFEYIKKDGLMSEERYPYEANDPYAKHENKIASWLSNIGYKSHRCEYDSHHTYTDVDTWMRATQHRDEELLMDNIYTYGPAAISVDAARAWQHYNGGIVGPESCSSHPADADHSVVVVGVGRSSSGIKYWIVRNQWDTDWGEDGYIRLEFGQNTCGIANDAYVVKVKK